MGILHAMVARGHVVLSEFSSTTTNASVIARQILDKLPPGNVDSNSSYSQDRYIFHVKRTDSLTVLCMADEASERRIPFAFLDDVHQQFVKKYGRAILTAAPYAMNEEFSRILGQEMERYSNDPNADRLNRLKGEMSQMRSVMISNIEKVLERGDRLALLVNKTTALQGSTLRFRKQSRRFKNTMWWENFKLTGCLLLILAIILDVVLATLCGGPFMMSCLKLFFNEPHFVGTQSFLNRSRPCNSWSRS